MSPTRMMIGGTVMLLVAGCSSLPGQPTGQVAYLPAKTDYEVVEDASDEVRPRRRARSSQVIHHSTGVEPLVALQQSQASRAKWKTGPVDYEKLQPVYLGKASDPRTTASVKGGTATGADPEKDALASMGRLIDNGKRAAAPICRGC